MISKKEFTEKVEQLLTRDSSDIIGTVLKVCSNENIEPESVKRLLSDPLKDKLSAEAEQLRLVRRGDSSRASINKFMM